MTPSPYAPRSFTWLGLGLLQLAACDGAHLSLGEDQVGGSGSSLVRTAGLPEFAEVSRLSELSEATNQDDPCLTGDELEIYFAAKRASGVGREDIWVARRDSSSQSFGIAELALAVNSVERETSPALSEDGLVLYFASDRAAPTVDLDIYRATRATRAESFDPPVRVDILSSSRDEFPHHIAGSWLPISRRSAQGDHDLYISRLNSRGLPEAPVALSELNTEADETGAALSDDGLSLVFASTREDSKGDLYYAARPANSLAFVTIGALTSVNTKSEESDPWRSRDGSRLYFCSTRASSVQELFVASEKK